jgi:hypothetical protein
MLAQRRHAGDVNAGDGRAAEVEGNSVRLPVSKGAEEAGLLLGGASRGGTVAQWGLRRTLSHGARRRSIAPAPYRLNSTHPAVTRCVFI